MLKKKQITVNTNNDLLTIQTSGQYISWLHLVGSLETLGISERIHTPAKKRKTKRITYKKTDNFYF